MTCKDVMFGVWFVRGDTQPRGVHTPPEKTYQARRSPMCAPCIRGRRAVFFLARLVTATSNWIIYTWKEQTAVHLQAFLQFDTLFFFVHFMKLYNPDWRVSSVFYILRMIRQMVLIVVN